MWQVIPGRDYKISLKLWVTCELKCHATFKRKEKEACDLGSGVRITHVVYIEIKVAVHEYSESTGLSQKTRKWMFQNKDCVCADENAELLRCEDIRR